MVSRIRFSEFLDKLVLLFAMLVFAWVGVQAIFEVKKLDRISGQARPQLPNSLVNAERREAQKPDISYELWAAPESQSRGEDWVFDVFTPPVIYYDPNSQEFAVTPPQQPTHDPGAALFAMFDLELLEVRPRPYRLQLVGYAGEPGTFVAYFEYAPTGELVLMREGEELSEFGVKLVSFKEETIRILSEESMEVVQDVGVARLLDFSTDQEISLTNRETKMFSDLEARLRDARNGAIYVAKTGNRLEFESGDYVIGDLSATPEQATITKVSKDGSRSFSRTLSLRPTTEIPPRDDSTQSSSNPFAPRPNG